MTYLLTWVNGIRSHGSCMLNRPRKTHAAIYLFRNERERERESERERERERERGEVTNLRMFACTHRYLIEIDVGSFFARAARFSEVVALAEPAAEPQQVPRDHRVHDDDEHEGRHQAGDAVDDADDAHGLEVLDLHVADLVAVHRVHDARGDEAVGVAGHRQGDEHQDDRLRPRDRAHVGPVQRVLHGDEALDGERDDQPDAQAAADRAHVHDRLAPAVLVEDPPAERVVQPDEQQRGEEAEVGGRQGGEVVARAAHLEVGVEEDDAGEEVAHEAEEDDERDVVLVGEVEDEVQRVALLAGLVLEARLDGRLEAAVHARLVLHHRRRVVRRAPDPRQQIGAARRRAEDAPHRSSARSHFRRRYTGRNPRGANIGRCFVGSASAKARFIGSGVQSRAGLDQRRGYFYKGRRARIDRRFRCGQPRNER